LDARAEPLANSRLRILARASFIWGFLILAVVLTAMMGTYMDYFIRVMHDMMPIR